MAFEIALNVDGCWTDFKRALKILFHKKELIEERISSLTSNIHIPRVSFRVLVHSPDFLAFCKTKGKKESQ